VTVDGRMVSSSAIRRLLLDGQCDKAEQLLGWTYEITGRIVRGVGRGAELKYPTANLEPDEPLQLLPRDGVYVVSAEIDQATVFGMGNIGLRPTFDEQKHTIEAHFFDPPRPDLYNRRITLRFHHRLRDEQRFQNALDLKKQLQHDEKASLSWITDNHGG
jgi:riboflavin kinase/FMN adenylyltransferase